MATTEVHVWLDDATMASLTAYATRQQMELTSAATMALCKGLEAEGRGPEIVEATALEDIVRRVVDARIQRTDDRLAALLVKNLREAAVGRWLTGAVLERQGGREALAQETDKALTAAGHLLRARGLPLPELDHSADRDAREQGT